jgi:hypothetical protein
MGMALIVIGGLGGVIPDVVRLIKGMHDPAVPAYVKSAPFYIGLVLLIGLGCLAAWLAGATNAKEALAYGYGAPELVTKILGSSDSARARGATPSIREWWGR